MKINPKRNKPLRLVVIIAMLVFSVLAVFELGKKPARAPENQNVSTAVVTEPSSGQTINPPTEPADLSLKQMPILMYHHIRLYNFDGDQIGTNLSVSPQNFVSQLDLIESKSFDTTTFSDFSRSQKILNPIILTFDDGYENFYENAYPELKKRNMKAVVFIITDYIGKNDYMTADQIKEVSQNGIEIGSHTKSHPDLSKLDQAQAKTEITESKAILEKIIGKQVISLCYPSGKYTNETTQTVKEAGYQFATTTKPGISKFSSPFELKRDRVNSDTHIDGFLR